MAAGVLNRHRPDYHKRLMLLGTIALLRPALARLVRMVSAPFLPLGVLGGLVVLNFYVAALIAFDLIRLGKVHPVTFCGALIFRQLPGLHEFGLALQKAGRTSHRY